MCQRYDSHNDADRSRTCFRDGRLSSAATRTGITMLNSATRPAITPARRGRRRAPPVIVEVVRLHIPVTGHRCTQPWIVHPRFIDGDDFNAQAAPRNGRGAPTLIV